MSAAAAAALQRLSAAADSFGDLQECDAAAAKNHKSFLFFLASNLKVKNVMMKQEVDAIERRRRVYSCSIISTCSLRRPRSFVSLDVCHAALDVVFVSREPENTQQPTQPKAQFNK